MYRAGFHVIITVDEKSSAIIVRLFVDIPSVIFVFADSRRQSPTPLGVMDKDFRNLGTFLQRSL